MSIFRDAALKRLRSPEQLDALLKLTTSKAWLALAMIGILIAVLIAWGLLGSVPVRVQGLGIILSKDTTIYDVPASGTGIIKEVAVTLGQQVAPGTQIAVISLPDLETQLAGAQRALENAKRNHDTQKSFSDRDIARRRSNTEATVRVLQNKIAGEQAQLKFYRSLLEEQTEELKLGYVTRNQVEQTRIALFAAEQTVGQAQSSIADAQTAQVEFENEQYRNLVELSQLVLEAENQLNEIQASLGEEQVVTSPVAGIVSELDVKPGGRIVAGQDVAVIRQEGEGLELVAFFDIGSGKKLNDGLSARVAPASVERDLYGSIEGRVISISDLPETDAGLQAVLGNAALASQMMADGAPIRAIIDLKEDTKTTSGLRWTSSKGPSVTITPGDLASVAVTVREERPIDLVIPIFETWITGS